MNKLFSTLLSAIRARFTSLWTKLRLWTSPVFWRAKVFTKIRQFFNRLFDVRPRHRKDYYPFFQWLVSKRLAFAIVVVLGIVCTFYLYTTLPKGFFTGGTAAIRTYRYNAIPLKFYAGTVRILAGDGHVAYVGEVEKAHCTGQGTLYNKEGGKVYEGAFDDDMYNGQGTLYYPEGAVQYNGTFVNNLFQGQGSYFRSNGTAEYVGAYEAGLRNGAGTLYNAASTPIFSGAFQNDQIVYGQFLGKSTADVAQMYTGRTTTYSGGGEYAASMDEIGAVYSASGGGSTLDGNWTVNSIYVLSNALPVDGGELTTINQLSAYFGQPDYYGVSPVTLPEAVAINLLDRRSDSPLGTVSITSSAAFDQVYTVSQYDKSYEVYIYTYLKDGLLYTFYTTGAGQDRFLMYAVELTT